MVQIQEVQMAQHIIQMIGVYLNYTRVFKTFSRQFPHFKEPCLSPATGPEALRLVWFV